MVESLQEDVILSLVFIDFPDVCIASSNLFRAISVVLPCTCMHEMFHGRLLGELR